MLKYLGSKRRLVPALTAASQAADVSTAADLFTGTTRVAQALKRENITVVAADAAAYSAVLAECFIATDAREIDVDVVAGEIRRLNELPGSPGYVTEVFCQNAKFFQPHNGERIDAIRDAIEDYRGTSLFPVLLTSLLLAADRVDSTTGVQMAYLKQWAPRSHRPLELRLPELLPGPGRVLAGDLLTTATAVGPVDLAYLDPPYNQHRYESNYHIWETLVRWDEPEHYGIACKRIDLRDPDRRSPFNSRRTFAPALQDVLQSLTADLVMLSYNDESWVEADELSGWLASAGWPSVTAIGFDSARYVGSRIGIHNPAGKRVGTVRRTRNVEWLFVAGDPARVEAVVAAVADFGGRPLPVPSV